MKWPQARYIAHFYRIINPEEIDSVQNRCIRAARLLPDRVSGPEITSRGTT
jgi:hypothetical protein